MLTANGREKRRRRLRLAGCGETALSMHKIIDDGVWTMLAANGREKRRQRLRLAGCGETALSMHKIIDDGV